MASKTSITEQGKIVNGLEKLKHPHEVTELRILHAGKNGTLSGYYDNLQALFRDALQWSGQVPGIYFTINPVNPALLARSKNKLTPRAKITTSDHDVVKRKVLYIDIDAVRPSGISSTDEEHQATLDKGREMMDWLKQQGWPECIIASSGNGCHLYYKIDLPNDDASKQLIRRCLEVLALKYGDDACDNDQSVFNAARISKLPRTLTCKGDNLPERPHREAKFIQVPDGDLGTVTREQLQALADMRPKQEKPSQQYQQHSSQFDLEQWIHSHDLKVLTTKTWQNATVYVLETCPFNPEHGKDSSIIQQPSGALGFQCFHNGCSGYTWHDLRDLLEPGWREKRRGAPNYGQQQETEQTTKNKPWEKLKPFDEHTLPSFPIHSLPSWLREYCQAVSIATQTPIDLPAILSLPVSCTALQKRYAVCMRQGWLEQLALFVAAVLNSGERKSPVFSLMVEPIEEYEQLEVDRLAPLVAEKQNKRRILEEKLKTLQSKASKAEPEEAAAKEQEAATIARELVELNIPSLPKLVVDDVSPEQLASILAQQGGRLSVLSGEGGIFDIMAGRYSQSGQANFEVFLKGYSGDTLRVDRVGRPPEYVKEPALSVGLTIQPEVLEGLFEKPGFRGRGLLARFFFILPNSIVGFRDNNPPPIDDSMRAIYNTNIKKMLSLSNGEEGKPKVLALSREAELLSNKFAEWLEPKLRDAEELHLIRDWSAKLHGGVGRIAGILHLSEHIDNPRPDDTRISGQTFQAAIEIGKYLIEHAKAAFIEMGTNIEHSDGKYLVNIIKKEECKFFSKQELWQKAKGKFKRAERMDKALDLLCDHNFIRSKEMLEREGPGRKPAPVYDVNPEVYHEKPAGGYKDEF